jgi:hypothetical protein
MIKNNIKLSFGKARLILWGENDKMEIRESLKH